MITAQLVGRHGDPKLLTHIHRLRHLGAVCTTNVSPQGSLNVDVLADISSRANLDEMNLVLDQAAPCLTAPARVATVAHVGDFPEVRFVGPRAAFVHQEYCRRQAAYFLDQCGETQLAELLLNSCEANH